MKFPYLTRRKGSGIYYFRRVVPPELQADYGKTEVNVSLNTRDPAKARPAYFEIASKTEADFAALRNGGEQSVNDQISPAAATVSSANVSDHYQTIIAEDFATRYEVLQKARADERAFWRQEIVKFPNTDWINFRVDEETRVEDVISHCFDERNKRRIWDAQCELETGDRSLFSSDLTPIEVRDLLLAEIAALNVILGRETTSNPSPGLPPPMATPLPPSASPLPTAPLLSEAVEKWIAEQSRGAWSVEYKEEAIAILGGFLEIVGDKPMTDYDKSDCRKFKSVILKLPPNVKKRKKFKNLSLEKAAEKAHARGLLPLSTNTVNKRLNTVASFFNWVIKQYDEMGVNPASGLGIKTKNSARSERDPFTITELNTMFAAPIYTGV